MGASPTHEVVPRCQSQRPHPSGQPVGNAWTNGRRHQELVKPPGAASHKRGRIVATGPITGFDSFSPSTRRMILFLSEEKDALGRMPNRPVQTFADILALRNVAYVQNHMHHFLRNTKGRDAFPPIGFCAAIRTASSLSDASDRPGAFSLFCCGPQMLARSNTSGRDALDHASTLVVQMPRLLENMAGVAELLFGPRSPLTQMLDEWCRFLTRVVGSTLASLRQLAHKEDNTVACRLPARLVHRKEAAAVPGTLCWSRAQGRHQPELARFKVHTSTARGCSLCLPRL